MGRTATKTKKPADAPEILPAVVERIERAQELATHTEVGAAELAVQIGYGGALTVGELEDGIRFYQRRSVEDLLECGKRLLLLKELTPHGEFTQRVQLLGFSDRSARRFMAAAAKTSKSANLAVLANRVQSTSAFLELITSDDDELKAIATLDDVDRMSASELRAALRTEREGRKDDAAMLTRKQQRIDKLEAENVRIQHLPPDEDLLELKREVAAVGGEITARVQGYLRMAFDKLRSHEASNPESDTVFLAGIVGEIRYELEQLAAQFSLPDVHKAHDDAVLAEIDAMQAYAKANGLASVNGTGKTAAAA